MPSLRSTSYFWTKTASILAFGALIGLWLGHQDKNYQPSPTSALNAVAFQQVAMLQKVTQDQSTMGAVTERSW